MAAVRAALGESADVVFDCVAIQSTVDQAPKLASNGGTVMIVGVLEKDVAVPLQQVQDLQMRIQGSASYMPEDYEESIRIIQTGGVMGRISSPNAVPLKTWQMPLQHPPAATR